MLHFCLLDHEPVGDTSRGQNQNTLTVLLERIAPGVALLAIGFGQGLVHGSHVADRFGGKKGW